MDAVVERCAGLDVHRDNVVATVRVPSGDRRRWKRETRTFKATLGGLLELAEWLPPALLVTAGSTIPFAIVDATLIEMNAPTKLRHPDMITATIGFSAPVAIDVATAFAVS